jgi:hypothetical protein
MNLIDVVLAAEPHTLPWTKYKQPVAISRSDFATPERLTPPPPGTSFARRFLITSDRAFVLRVSFGVERPSDALLARANAVLRTLAIAPWRPEECPPNWPGPWTACPEAQWVRDVAERGGYRIVGETGSALVAQGGGRSFHIWATELTEPLRTVARKEKWREFGTVEGVPVYGDEALWRWWAAQGFAFWLQAGPRVDAELPTLGEMASLIRASKELAPPG